MSNVNCACVIHGDKYGWQYVDRLYAMLCRHISQPITLHVWTELTRPVPAPYVKHGLTEWAGINGPRKSWWYKMQMFDPAHALSGPVLYFDLDVVIMDSLDWMPDLDQDKFWAVRDFRYLWKPTRWEINSSIMRWDPDRYHWIWQDFCEKGRETVTRRFVGDQDYLNSVLPRADIGFFDTEKVISYRWQIHDGGWDNRSRVYKQPGAGDIVPEGSAIAVFHGSPKPHELQGTQVLHHWI